MQGLFRKGESSQYYFKILFLKELEKILSLFDKYVGDIVDDETTKSVALAENIFGIFFVSK